MAIRERWEAYRRALRRRDQHYFDELFEYAETHADASGYLNTDEAMHPILFSMLLEQQREIAQLQDRVAALESSHQDQET